MRLVDPQLCIILGCTRKNCPTATDGWKKVCLNSILPTEMLDIINRIKEIKK